MQHPKRLKDHFNPYEHEYFVYRWKTFHSGFRVMELVCVCDWIGLEGVTFNSTTRDSVLDDLMRWAADEYNIPVKDLVIRYG